MYCEHQADVYCVAEGVHEHSFCTNGGTCIEYVGPDEAHVGCKCPDNYEGSHCQFVKGTQPEGWPYTNELPKKNGYGHSNGGIDMKGSSAGFIIALIVVVVVCAIMGAAMMFRRFNKSEDVKDGITGRDLNLDADGDELKIAMQDPVNHDAPLRGKSTDRKDDESLVSIT